MDEQFDNHLKNHIREVFENFEDPAADEGWMLLREKFPTKTTNRPIMWLWLGIAAAILLLMLGIGTWVNLKKEEPTKLSYKPVKHYQPQNNKASNKASTPVIKEDSSNAVAYNRKTGIAANALSKTQTRLITPKYMSAKAVAKNTSASAAAKPGSTNYPAENLVADQDVNKPAATNNKPAITPALMNDTATKNSAIAVTIPKSVVKPNTLPFTEKPNDTKEQKAAEAAKINNSVKAVQFSVYAATYFNYAKGSNTNLNIGAGVTLDIRLTKNLKLSTGIAIAQNTLNYGSQIPAEAVQEGYAAIANTYQAGGPANANKALYSSIYSAPSFKDYNAQLVALDVPVNLKYEFDPQKNNSYISVGLSSGTFINESYTYQYNYANTSASSLAAQQTQAQTSTSSFSNFYFAKTLNFSFGMGYPLGKNHLIVEPFLKYPLEGLGAQQIRFGAGGINLKFDFINSKK